MADEKYYCSNCESQISGDIEYCLECGSLFNEYTICINHSKTKAEGACVFCHKVFCTKCAHNVNSLFICLEHDNFEIIEGHARIRGSSDLTFIEYYKEILAQAELNPIIYTRKSNPIQLGGLEYSVFRPASDPKGHLINEYKLMLPLNEVLKAESIILDLEKNYES